MKKRDRVTKRLLVTCNEGMGLHPSKTNHDNRWKNCHANFLSKEIHFSSFMFFSSNFGFHGCNKNFGAFVRLSHSSVKIRLP